MGAVFLFTTINFIAAEIENPFGMDENDIDLTELQDKFNDILVTMLSPTCTKRPMLRKPPMDLESELNELISNAEPAQCAWERLGGDENECKKSRRSKGGLQAVLGMTGTHTE